MPAWIAIAAGAQIGSAILGSNASNTAANQALDLSRTNAWMIQQETNEQTRRLKFSQGRTRAKTRATQAASGFRSGKRSMGASARAYEKTLASVQQSELDWIQKSSKSRIDLVLKQGTMESANLRTQATGQLFGGVASAASTLYKGFSA